MKVQKLLFVMMSGVYPLVTKRCLGLLHCNRCDSRKQCDAGGAMLMSGPTIARSSQDDATGKFRRVELRIPCWQGEPRASKLSRWGTAC